MPSQPGDTLSASMTPYWASAATLGVMVLIAAVLAPTFGVGLYMTSGVWAALAVDLADGTFYRPIISDLGYGGTRYFPVHFVLNGGLIRLLGDPVAAAHVISYASGLLLLGGVYRCMRKLGAPRPLAATCALLSFSALSMQACLFQLRPDGLAAAFNMWGLSYCIRPKEKDKHWIVGASCFFALAFLTKFTTVFGITAAALYWALTGRRREAAILAAVTAGLSATALVAVHIASEGRALESFLACAAGSTTFQTLMKGPLRFFYTPRIDVAFLLVFAAGLFVWIKRLRTGYRDLLALFFFLTFGATAIIASDEGAGINHFVDIHIAAALLLVAHISQGAAGKLTRYALPAAGMIGALIIGIAVVFANSYYAESRYEQQDKIIAITGDSGGPLLSDDPWIPILAGERPYVLDNYSLRTIGENDPAIADDLFAKLDDRFFRAAVLFYGNQAPRGPNRNLNIEIDARRLYYSWMLYPEGFYDRLTQNYAPIEFVGDYLVLLPR